MLGYDLGKFNIIVIKWKSLIDVLQKYTKIIAFNLHKPF